MSRDGQGSACRGAEQWDGRLSIEHQLDIHISDLEQVGGSSSGPQSIAFEVLTGLRYVVDYRIRDKEHCSLDGAICSRLVRALLLQTGLRGRKAAISFARDAPPSANAQMAFVLLLDFASHIDECLLALSAIEVGERARRLRLAHRLLYPSDKAMLAAAEQLFALLRHAVFDWKDLFENSSQAQEVIEAGFIDGTPEASSRAAEGNVVRSPKYHTGVLLFPPPALYFDRSTQRVLDMFKTDEAVGIVGGEESIAMRRAHYGANEMPVQKVTPWWRVLAFQFVDLIIIMLIATSVLTAIIDWPEVASALVIILVVVINVVVGFWQEMRSLHTIAAMHSLQSATARVRRDGEDVLIDAKGVVPGDIVVVEEGDSFPADLRLIKTHRLMVRETILTGESQDVSKSAKHFSSTTRTLPLTRCTNTGFMGTLVTRGSAVGVAVRIGRNSEVGRIGAALADGANKNASDRSSPLRTKMAGLVKVIVALAIALCIFVFLAGVFIVKRDAIEMVRLSISLAISVIPEGFVSALTMAMALAVRRLANKSVLVRRLHAIETIGVTSVVASDKTGTLTEGIMRMEAIFCLGSGAAERLHSLSACIQCNNATDDGKGEATESALLLGATVLYKESLAGLVQGEQVSRVDGDEYHPSRPAFGRVAEVPFDSDRRMMTVAGRSILQDKALGSAAHQSGDLVVYSKGAAEVVMACCTHIMIDDQRVPFSEEHMARIVEAHDRFSDDGLRVLALAMKRVSDEELNIACLEELKADYAVEAVEACDTACGSSIDSDIETKATARLSTTLECGMTFLGLACLEDPPRRDAAESVALCEGAGIKVIMITGDHMRTAINIATRLGIYDGKNCAKNRSIKGQDLDLMDVDGLASLRPFPSVFARVSPHHKLLIVQALQQRGETVVMTGDGVNDAPAIRFADVGIAIGNSAQITRDAAALILLEGRFDTIVTAISHGRQMFHNIALFLIYLLSCNSAEIWTILLGLLLHMPPALSPMNILWANVIADIPPSLALTLEHAPRDRLMRDTPLGVSKTVIGPTTALLISANGLVLAALALFAFHLTKDSEGNYNTSEPFTILVGLQMLLALISRSPSESLFTVGLFGNSWLVIAVVASFGLLLAGIYVPFLADILDLQPVGWAVWGKFVVAAVIMIACNELTKLAIRRIRYFHR